MLLFNYFITFLYHDGPP